MFTLKDLFDYVIINLQLNERNKN